MEIHVEISLEIFENNGAPHTIITNNVKSNTKKNWVMYTFVKNIIYNGLIEIFPVDSCKYMADMLTKALPRVI